MGEISKYMTTAITLLCQLRHFLILTFGISAILAFVFLFSGKNHLFLGCGSLAHISIFLWLRTEAFGPIAKHQTSLNRIFARTFLFISTLVVLGILLSLFKMPFV